jgi:Na+-driven multidrug efflux pump
MQWLTVTSDRWRIRRRMAITSFLCGILYPLLLLVAPEKAGEHLVAVAMPFYTFATLIVNWYITAVTWEDNKIQERSVGKPPDLG